MERARVIDAKADDRLDDEQIVERARAGEAWAEEVLLRRHGRAIGALATRLLGNRADAEDVLQETFIAALNDLYKLRDPKALRPWLKQIAVRKAHRVFRKRRLLRAFGLDQAPDDASLELLAARDASPEVCAELALLDRKLSELKTKDRIAWMLRHVEGHTLPEVARLCTCSLATAKRRVRAANESLRLEVDDE